MKTKVTEKPILNEFKSLLNYYWYNDGEGATREGLKISLDRVVDQMWGIHQAQIEQAFKDGQGFRSLELLLGAGRLLKEDEKEYEELKSKYLTDKENE